MKLSTFPFRRPDAHTVRFGGWFYEFGDEFQNLPTELDYWDFQRELELRAQLDVDVHEVLTQSHLSLASTLGVTVSVTSEAANFESGLTPVPLAVGVGQKAQVPVSVKVKGQLLSKACILRLELVAIDPIPTSRLGAEHPGAILWENHERLILQGEGSQFPTYAEDFRVGRPASGNALWEIHVDASDLEASFLSNVHVVLNSGRAEVRELMRGVDSKATRALQQHLDLDVTRRLVSTALSLPEVVVAPLDFDDPTVKGGLRKTVALIWPTEDIRYLSEQQASSPGTLEAKIQNNRSGE